MKVIGGGAGGGDVEGVRARPSRWRYRLLLVLVVLVGRGRWRGLLRDGELGGSGFGLVGVEGLCFFGGGSCGA